MHDAHLGGPLDTAGPVRAPHPGSTAGPVGHVRGGRTGHDTPFLRRRLTAPVVAVALLLVGCSGGDPVPTDAATATADTPTPSPSSTDAAPSEPAAAGLPASALEGIEVRSADEQPAPAPPAPAVLTVASVDISMDVVPVGVADDGTMAIPETALDAGWYQHGPAPASPAGTTVLAAHVDTRTEGLGPFARLVDVAVGADVTVVDGAGTVHRYTVSTVERVSKEEVPLADVFDRAGAQRLVLVTCGGNFDRSTGHYVDNVIVTAVPAG
ncbi:class F sortase [Sanguibacter suaedae]|uniref:Class F sortase n=1 Tax=Sanguibacter suaedae TaxID=2795737 RepID=A0A934MEM2_9MICO|nr:class F sortase [Sanguibacter suaedae]MBI9115829.1 class F sortase [Sanguibacter suaedae]